MNKEEIIELIKEKLERAEDSWKTTHKIAPSSYGEGVDWGECSILNELLEEIK